MLLTRHGTPVGPRWAADGRLLPPAVGLSTLLALPAAEVARAAAAAATDEPADGPRLAPVDPVQEVWAAGVTYQRSREARMSESETKDIYDKVYEADRVEVFFKAVGWRVAGPGAPIRVRGDSAWNVPEPELAVVLCRGGEIVGFTVGNDVSSRDIEGANPLYLPQAKVYDGSAALGPGIRLGDAGSCSDLGIRMEILRGGETVFTGDTRTSQLKRTLPEIASWLTRELAIPEGAILMTGTGIVPPDEFSLGAGDTVRIDVDGMVLENPVA